jgi:glycosyltransferase involved in cell wall biosynthesis
MSGPTVSVVIPAYNHAGYLAQAIDSVLGQDYPVELIVLDDGSTDGTREVLAPYDGRFHWESHANMGQAATLNKGWAMAKGDIVGYLSADDALRSGCVRAAVETLAAHPDVVLTYCDFVLLDPGSHEIRTVRTEDFDYARMVVDLVCMPGPGVFFRRAAFERVGGWDPAFRQMPDYDYWLRLGLLGNFKRIPRALAGFRVHDQSLSFAPTSERSAAEPQRIMEKYFGLEAIPETIRARRSLAGSNALLFSAQLHLRSGRYAAAYACARQAAAGCPYALLRPMTLRRLANGLFSRMGYRFLRMLPSRRAAGEQP